MMTELELLLCKITDSEDFVDRAERFFAEKSDQWSPGVQVSFEKFLERKRDQIYYERDRAQKMGWNMAVGLWPPRMDI
jgi:hypothetical protein